MRQIALCVLFTLSLVVSLGCKSEAAKVATGKVASTDFACVPGWKPCTTYDDHGNLVDGMETASCSENGTLFYGECRPFKTGQMCEPGDTLVGCNCDYYGNLGSAQCLSDGSRWSWGACICYGDDGAGGGSNTSTTTDTGAGGSAPTTTSTTTETNSGTGGGDAGQGGQGGSPQPADCDKPVRIQLDPDSTPNNTFVVQAGDNVVMNSFMIINPCNTDQVIKQFTLQRADYGGTFEDFVNPFAFYTNMPQMSTFYGEIAMDSTVTFKNIIAPASSAHRFIVAMTIPETKPHSVNNAAHSGDSGMFVPKMAWSGDDWKSIAIGGDYNPTRVIIHQSAPNIYFQWNHHGLINGMNELATISIVTNPGHEVDIRQLILKVEHSPEINLDATQLEAQGFSPFYVNGGPMAITPGTKVFHPGWDRAVYMNAADGELAVSDQWQNHLEISLHLNVSGVKYGSWVRVSLDDEFTADKAPRRMQVVSVNDPGVVLASDVVNGGPPLVSAFLWTDKSEGQNHQVMKPSSADYFGMFALGGIGESAFSSAQ